MKANPIKDNAGISKSNNSAVKKKVNSATKKPISTTGARVGSRYGALKPVGNPGAGVYQREKVASDWIKGAKPAKKK